MIYKLRVLACKNTTLHLHLAFFHPLPCHFFLGVFIFESASRLDLALLFFFVACLNMAPAEKPNDDAPPPAYPAQAHFDAGPAYPEPYNRPPPQDPRAGGVGSPPPPGAYGSSHPPPGQFPPLGGFYGSPPGMQQTPPPPGGYYGPPPPGMHYGPPPPHGYYNSGYPPQGNYRAYSDYEDHRRQQNDGLCAGIFSAMACCCCLDMLMF